MSGLYGCKFWDGMSKGDEVICKGLALVGQWSMNAVLVDVWCGLVLLCLFNADLFFLLL